MSALLRSEADVRRFKRLLRHHVKFSQGRELENASRQDVYNAAALSVRDLMMDGFLETEKRYRKDDVKRLYYLSMEFLMGKSLASNLQSLGAHDACAHAVAELGFDLEDVKNCEPDAALGNGGLGRLAACFLDSLASLGLPGFGYGINYEFGLFRQEIDNGYQKEKPDRWLSMETPWLLERPEEACLVPIYGKIEHEKDRAGNYNPMWMDWRILVGVPSDMLIPGYGGRTVHYLRLYSARASDEFDIRIFNEGDYFKAVEQKISSETLSKVLYPSDSIAAGRELRLLQEYFLVACSIRDIVRRFYERHIGFDRFPEKVAIQLNDTHPALSVAELMRVLVDEIELPWDLAWTITQKTFGYTNHTLLPEALEKWPVSLLEHVLPRHLQIIYEINHRFLQQVAILWPGDAERQERMSLIEEGESKQVRMAHLAVVGSHSINGVAGLHTELLKSRLFSDFYQLWPERFSNKTNGVTQRRWVLGANPPLADLLQKAIGDRWIRDWHSVKELEAFADDAPFLEELRRAKRCNKEILAKIIFETTRVKVDPESLFDVQIKRIHEYKRQLLNLMHIMYRYLSLTDEGEQARIPTTYIFAGKAAPGYFAAKLIIKMINSVGAVIHSDPRAKDQLKIVFLPDYRVSLAEKIIPAADLSEQISTAGMEASGTGNMKLALNGALTIGTMDGATIEIAEEVGAENLYLFGLTAEEIQRMRSQGSYNPWDYYTQSAKIRRVMDAIDRDRFCPGEPGLFRPIYEKLLNEGDFYFNLADFESYLDAQERAALEYPKGATWTRKAALTIARTGKFSSDRAVSDYARDIWNIGSPS